MKKLSRKRYKNETERVIGNPYLVKKLTQSQKDTGAGKGVKIEIDDL
ncbi:MAG: hypothetical protein ACTHMI_03645 [Mucilaginibacter sp.]